MSQSENKNNGYQPAKGIAAGSTLISLLGIVAAAGLYGSIPSDESGRKQTVKAAGDHVIIVDQSGPLHLKAYHGAADRPNVWTICDGDTHDVTPTTVETPEGCALRLEKQLVATAKPVLRTSPMLNDPGRDYQKWAIISMAYNIGPGAYAKTTVAKLVAARQWKAACARIKTTYVTANGRLVAGLVKRRERESKICMTGL